MKNKENKEKDTSFGQFIGKATANLIVVCVSACVWSILLAIVYKFITWIAGMVL